MLMTESMDHVRIVVFGRVQGVGFRAFAHRVARGLGLRGEVWNRADGAVELEAEGERAMLEQLAETLRRGAPSSEVTAIDLEWSAGPSRHPSFRISASRPR